MPGEAELCGLTCQGGSYVLCMGPVLLSDAGCKDGGMLKLLLRRL